MSDYLPYLPQELITKILLRLPTRFVGKFRRISKSWCSLLTSPHFIKSHLALQESHDPENLILISYYDHTLHTTTFEAPQQQWQQSAGCCFKKNQFFGVPRKVGQCDWIMPWIGFVGK
ncbi:hypothetical protein ACH5RR_021059 [Cinchona calisaya]|uniref:F-box domain-containing protein n=1 Tax=Cinchona calisaya TaxID=153742 RepID=A0ABD2ZJI0_9GENT